jgi:uncharacterized alkaline shock family protein YloU
VEVTPPTDASEPQHDAAQKRRPADREAPAAAAIGDSDADRSTVDAGASTTVDEQVAEAISAARTEMQLHAHARAVEVAPSVLTAVLATPRRSLPIRARDHDENTYVSERVITALLRRHIDNIPGFAVNRVRLDVDLTKTLTAVNIEVIAQYNRPIPEGAQTIRVVVEQQLERALGPATRDVQVLVTNVHVNDVIIGDPAVEHPEHP